MTQERERGPGHRTEEDFFYPDSSFLKPLGMQVQNLALRQEIFRQEKKVVDKSEGPSAERLAKDKTEIDELARDLGYHRKHWLFFVNNNKNGKINFQALQRDWEVIIRTAALKSKI